MFTPNSNIKLLQGTRLSYGSGHTYLFDWEEDQLAFFNSKVKLEYTKSNIVVIDGSTIKLNVNYAQVYDCDYMMFQNSDYSYIWFYAFIDKVTYISENVTSISYTIDVLQTWMFRYSLDYCFVERETVESDVIGEHTLTENVQGSTYIITNEKNYTFTDIDVVLYATEEIEALDGQFSKPAYINGMPITCYYINLGRVESFNMIVLTSILQQYALAGKSNAIISLFTIPSNLLNEKEGEAVSIPFTLASRILPYTPKNNKLYTYPYCCLTVESNNSSIMLLYELFNSTPSSVLTAVFGSDTLPILIPTNYNNREISFSDVISSGGFPILPHISNSYLNYIAQNKNQISSGIIGTGLSTFTNAVTGFGMGALASAAGGPVTAGVGATVGALTGIVGGAINVYNQLSKQEDMKVIPNENKGSTQAGNTLTLSKQNGFYSQCRTYKRETLAIIDDYFSMYGYKVNSLKKPNLKSRKYWNYIKTVETNLSTTINVEVQNEIKKLYENGITFWHGDYMYNYALDNSIGTPEPPDPPDPPTPTYIEYAIFPQQNVRITQRQNGSYSHQGTLAIDYADISPTYARMYAPFKVKVLAINVPLSNSNCVYFGSCDSSGIPKAVRCNDGVDRILTVMCMHDSDISNLRVGQIINSGDWFYNQGIKGDVTGSHVHMEVAEGWQTNRIDKGNPSWEIVNAIDQAKIWQLDRNWNTIIDTMGYNFPFVNGRGGNV